MKRKAITAMILLVTLFGAGAYRGYAVERDKKTAESIVAEARTEAEKIQDAQNEVILNAWRDRVYPGLTLMGVDLSGLTRTEAKNLLDTDIMQKLKEHAIEVKVKDKTFSLTLDKLDIDLDSDRLADEAVSYGKDLIDREQLNRIGNAVEEEMSLVFGHSDEKMQAFVDKLADEVNQEAKNATIKRKDGAFTVTSHEEGLVVDEERLIKDIRDALGEMETPAVIEAQIVVSQPKVTAESLQAIDGQLGGFTTTYGTSAEGRKYNVGFAASKINGAVIMPGETFSYNKRVGDVTAAAGFKSAGVYIGDKVEQGIGGGLCQVSSTLYQAALHSNLTMDQRRNHSMAVAYMKPGMDAVVYEPYLDLKFTNPYEHPVYIYAYGSGSTLTVAVYGHTADMNGYSYKIFSETTSVIKPQVVRKADDTKMEGEEEVSLKAVTGYTAKTYKQTIKDGKVVKTEQISQDSYKKVDQVILYGTKKKPAPQPEAPAAPKPAQPKPADPKPAPNPAPAPAPTNPVETQAP